MIPRQLSPSWRVLLGIGCVVAIAATALAWQVLARDAPSAPPTPAATPAGFVDVASFQVTRTSGSSTARAALSVVQ